MAQAHVTHDETTDSDNAFLKARVYWRVSAVALTAVALLGIALNAVLGSGAWVISENFLAFDWTHNIVHVALAAVAFAFGFGPMSLGVIKKAAVVVGGVYAGLAVLGFMSAGLFGIGDALALHLELGENLVHLVLGAWGLAVGLTN